MIYRSRRMHALALLAGLAATLVTIGVRPSASAEVTPTVSPVRTFYVSPSGSDSNPGSQAQPWKSFYKASQTVTGGDLVLFENGRYVETRAPWLRDRARNGTASKPIVLKARNSHGAVLRFSGLPTEKIYIDIDYVTVQGFVMTQDKPGTTTMDKFVNASTTRTARSWTT